MVKPISNIIVADKTHNHVFSQIAAFNEGFGCRVIFVGFVCIPNYSKLLLTTNLKQKMNYLQSYFYFLGLYKLYKLNTDFMVLNPKKVNIYNCKIYHLFRKTVVIGDYCKCQKYDSPIWQHRSKVINTWLKLYIKILSKCMYTSLELAVRAAALIRAILEQIFALPILLGLEVVRTIKNNAIYCGSVKL
jgi:hypothetical protein